MLPETTGVVHVVRPDGALTQPVLEAGLARAEHDDVLLGRPPPRLGLVPFARGPFALVVGGDAPQVSGACTESYRVRTSVPRDDGRGSVGMVTLFRRRPGLDDAQFLQRWHDGHSPLALRVHPLVRYVRHEVLEALDSAPPLDGIVIEELADRADLVRPWRFFGGGGSWLVNAARIGLDARGFIHLATIENHLVTFAP